MGILVLRNLKDYDENEENVVSFFFDTKYNYKIYRYLLDRTSFFVVFNVYMYIKSILLVGRISFFVVFFFYICTFPDFHGEVCESQQLSKLLHFSISLAGKYSS